MKRVFIISMLSATCAVLLLGGGCSQAPTVPAGKIPITTTSREAFDLYVQGRDMQERFLFFESKPILEQAVELDSGFALAYLALAFAQPTGPGFFEKLNKAVSFSDKVSDGETLMILAVQAGINADPVQQGRYMKQLTAIYPADERARTLRATYYFGQQKYREAIAQYLKATKIAPDHAPPWNMLGYCNRTIERYNEAEKAFRRYIELTPGDPNPLDSYAELLLKSGRYDESIQNYRKALEAKPDFVPSFIGIASNHVCQDHHDPARRELAQLLNIAENNAQRRTAHFAIALTFVDEQKYDEALDALGPQFDLAKADNDHTAMAADFTSIGSIQFEAGRYDDALANYQRAKQSIDGSELSDEIKENARRALFYNEARVAMKQDDLKSAHAKADSFQALASAIGNTAQIRLAYELLGMIALEEKDYEAALAAFNIGNSQNPYNLFRTALAYQGMGDPAKAREFCEKAANFNSLLSNLNFVFVRTKARQMLTDLPEA